MSRPSLTGAWQSAVVLAAAICLATTAAGPAFAEPNDQLELPPAVDSESVKQEASGLDALLAKPREGAAVNYVDDAAQLDAPKAGALSAESAAGTGSISGWVWALTSDGFGVGIETAQVTAFAFDVAANDYVPVGTATTTAGGAYTIDELAAGSYLVLFVPPNYPTSFYLPEFWEDAPITEWATEVVVADGANTSNINEQLEPLLADYIAGEDRYQTSVAISSAAFAPGVECVYIASGANFPDALSAGPAASKCGGPLLLIPPTYVPDVVAAELDRLDPAEIILAGGTAAVASGVESTLRSYAPIVRRIAGTDRYDTSRKIVDDAFDSAEAVWVATGENFPDALSASGAASAAWLPVLIVPGNASTLDYFSAAAISGLSPSAIAIAGGTSVVSAGVESSLGSLASVTRFGGADRYQTGLLINRAVWNTDAGARSVYAFLTNGEKFPDALSGAAMAGGYLGAPLYVVPPACTPADVQQHIRDLGVYEAYLLGYFSEIRWGEPLRHCFPTP